MKIIHRYVIREFLESFLFGLAAFSSILLIDQILELTNLLLNKGISLWIVVKLFLLILPNIFSLTIPMAGLFGILLSFGRLSEDNEITAMRSSGLRYITFTGPVLGVILILSLFLVYFNNTLSPSTHNQFRKIFQEVLNKKPLVKFEEKSFINVGEYRLFVQRVDKKNNILHGVNIYKLSRKEKDDSNWRISASSAAVSMSFNRIVFNLYSGHWQKPNPFRPDSQLMMNFAYYHFTVPLDTGGLLPFSQSFKEMTSDQLRQEIGKYKAKRMPTNFIETEYWLRWTLALAPLFFAIVGIPLGLVSERGGKVIGFGMSLVIFFLYYLLLIVSLNVSEKGILYPAFALWLPNAATLLAGLFLWKKMLRT